MVERGIAGAAARLAKGDLDLLDTGCGARLCDG